MSYQNKECWYSRRVILPVRTIDGSLTSWFASVERRGEMIAFGHSVSLGESPRYRWIYRRRGSNLQSWFDPPRLRVPEVIPRNADNMRSPRAGLDVMTRDTTARGQEMYE